MKVNVPLWLGVAVGSAVTTWTTIGFQFVLSRWPNADWSQDVSYTLWGITNVTALFITPAAVFLAAFTVARSVALAKGTAK
jgi:hypothetical protein